MSNKETFAKYYFGQIKNYFILIIALSCLFICIQSIFDDCENCDSPITYGFIVFIVLVNILIARNQYSLWKNSQYED